MLITENKILEKKQVYILVFIQKITSKNMQDLVFFLQENNFNMKRITKKYIKQNFGLNIKNSNFILESSFSLDNQQLRSILTFLKKHTNINGILFKNQVLTFERVANLEEKSQINLWKQIQHLSL